MTLTGPLALAIACAGAVAGALGVALGLGGGILLVPFLTLVLGLPLKSAAAISLCTVIATSSAVAAARAGTHLINLRLGMVLEVATVAGGLTGGITAQLVPEPVLERLFAVTMGVVGAVMLTRASRSAVSCGPQADPGPLGGCYHDAGEGALVSYQVTRLPIALGASFVAGNLSSLLGIGGGVVKVPVLNAWCGVPMRAAAATSALMIGVTATGGAIIYYGHGDLDVLLAAPAILGVQVGSRLGMRFTERASAKWLTLLMACVLFAVAGLMITRSAR